MALTDQDIEAIAIVSQAMSSGFILAGATIMAPFASDPKISPLGMLLGVAQSHIDGLASALATLEPTTRDNLIASVPAQLKAIIERAGS
ncbi:hypothetical protein [Sphingomonas bisphenolicum]|nr:hypothetical protein [Sphingomonas bisphenolicum]